MAALGPRDSAHGHHPLSAIAAARLGSTDPASTSGTDADADRLGTRASRSPSRWGTGAARWRRPSEHPPDEPHARADDRPAQRTEHERDDILVDAHGRHFLSSGLVAGVQPCSPERFPS
jgi:hypothetical protein